MLAGRVLPPILQAPPPHSSVPPVATFFNIPRRYVRSNMQVGDNASLRSPVEDMESSRSLRKSNRIHELRSSATTSPVQRTKEDQLPSPASSSPRASKKRVASFELQTNGADATRSDSLVDSGAPPSASSTGSGELSGHVCLCQPEPKIPRPRNAFILYRQHHQHDIVARNPGIANPEISKVIGEQWKAEGEDIKKIWQNLAEEEKARHHTQYPDYRYQPRRQGKLGSVPLNVPSHTTVEKYRCPRCGGRSIKTPTSPFPTPLLTPTLPPPNTSEGHTPTTRYLPMMSNLSLESPARRRIPGPSGLNNIQTPMSARDDYSPMTPDCKRRRFNNYPPSSNGRRPDAPYYTQHSRRDSLPPIQMRHSPPNTATMPPPRTPRDACRGSVDLNLLVPSQHDQSRSVEAMVMSVPYNVKIKVLGRITPALKDPSPSSPAVSIRGAIIAVEGEDLAAVKELTDWLYAFLTKDKDYAPRLSEPPKAPAEDATSVSFVEYLELIKSWHGKSEEMVKYITTPITPPSSNPSTSDDEKDDDNDSKASKDSKMKDDMPPPSSSSFSTSSPKPVIILPTYQLHASDAYASKIPIQDVYSPMDHWQWMATLWRGTVGPDLTIYVKKADPPPNPNAVPNTANANAGAAGNGAGGNAKLVDLNEEGRCLTVIFKEKSEAVKERFSESALRRVGFEVGEWVRGVGSSGRDV